MALAPRVSRLVNAQTAVGSYGPFAARELTPGVRPAFQFIATSFNARIFATLDYDVDTGVGSSWMPITSEIDSSGLFVMDDNLVMPAYLVQINSLAPGAFASVLFANGR